MKTIKQRISYAVMGLMAMGFTACTQNIHHRMIMIHFIWYMNCQQIKAHQKI